MRLLLIAAFLTLALSACSTSPSSKYYFLSAEPIAAAPAKANDVRIVVGPITVPALNDRPQLISQTGKNEVQINEYHRWAGSLNSNISRIITANIAQDLGAPNVWSFSQSTPTKYDYQVFIDVQTLESKPGDEVIVDALWTIKSTKAGHNEPTVGRTLVHESVAGEGFNALVAAQSRAFAKVSKDIALSGALR
ncbi:putative lipoprotein YmbA [Polynucleobacter sphagniphilus]|jgi:uncharacterized lipoprotein YmbA|uniref:PqiC family protein n=1 Tax=Polynucleobacter sphagniphilus TaxID=1743169 RepID=UPI002473D813|nr:PqiC family protein [Polynucleobacter sphagniphilus]MDH6155824.1 putative lipoprotein YmbA [Polynucleobacter sphagniphilus]MDH6249743.1 putative lipoprotein YmbA [Polynucleobacter sphagniphilus]MDH6300499.1 putative lipoprotein YmbA [Polynucleobacter sphagniphilus]MDH6303217.1 putative lipoprotein YmbA [Polynucleobacter sphagniphilus]